MAAKRFVVHPNRDAVGPDRPGHNGHFRVLESSPDLLPEETCAARVVLPAKLAHAADYADGSVIFAGHHWGFVVGAARSFAQRLSVTPLLPSFGYRLKGVWRWWDGTTTSHSVLDGPDAGDHVQRYLCEQFQGATIEITDLR